MEDYRAFRNAETERRARFESIRRIGEAFSHLTTAELEAGVERAVRGTEVQGETLYQLVEQGRIADADLTDEDRLDIAVHLVREGRTSSQTPCG